MAPAFLGLQLPLIFPLFSKLIKKTSYNPETDHLIHVGETYHCAFSRRVSPWFVVAGEDTHMATAHELFIVQTKDRIVRVQKVGVENNLHSVAGPVEKLAPTNMQQNGVCSIVRHVVGHDWRKRVTLQGKHTSLQRNLILV